MRILHLVHQYPPDHLGGTELYTQTLATTQAARGHAVTIFAPSIETAVTIENEVSIRRVPLGQRSAQATFFSTFTQPALIEAWHTAVQQTQPDLVHVQHVLGLPAATIDVLHQQRIPYIVTLHDYYYLCANAMLLTNYDQAICAGPRAWINCGHCALARAGYAQLAVLSPGLAPLLAYRHARLRRILDQAYALIAPTEFVRELYQRQFHLPPDRIRVIPHGIPLPAEIPSHVPQPELHIGYIGGLAPHKGVHVLIEAVKPLSAARLTIYGDLTAQPEYAQHLQSLATSPRIQLAGRLPHTDLYRALAQLDVVVVPSVWYETSALIVQEAAAARVPVIASDVGALRETTLNNGGVVFPMGDAAALRAQLQRLIDEPAQLARLRDNLKAPRSIDDHVSEIEALYREVVA